MTMGVSDTPVKDDGPKRQRVRTWETDAVDKAKKLKRDAGKHASGDTNDPIGGLSSENGNWYI